MRDRLAPPLAVHRAGESAVLAEYPGIEEVLAATAAVRALAPAHLRDLVPAERTLLLAGTAARDVPALTALLRDLPPAPAQDDTATEVAVGIVYDGEDLEEVAALLRMSPEALIDAHSSITWTAAFGGFAPGFAYLLPDAATAGPAPSAQPTGRREEGEGPVDPPWDVPRRSQPRTAVPAGAVGLAARYCGIYPRSSPGGWQLIGRSDAALFDVEREPPALLSPGTRVRFVPERPTARVSAGNTALAQVTRAAREAAAPVRRGRRRGAAGDPPPVHEVLEVLSPGPLTLCEDTGRPGRAASGVSASGAFDRGALMRANLAVGNPAGAAALESLAGPLQLRARAATVVALSGARAPLSVHRADEDGADLELTAQESQERAIALDPGDRLELGPAAEGLRLVLAVRGGLQGAGAQRAVLGSLSRDTLSALGPEPLRVGEVLSVGPGHGLDAVPPAPATEEADEVGEAGEAPPETVLEVPVHPGPRDALLGAAALAHLLATPWTVRADSDRVGVRLDGEPLPVPEQAASLPSEPMVPGAIQVPPSGLPVVFGPDHPTTGGYPVLAVVPRAGLDALAQAGPGLTVRFVTVPGSPRRG